jgi:hypothetical protein
VSRRPRHGLVVLLALAGSLGCARSAADVDPVLPDDAIEDEPSSAAAEASEPGDAGETGDDSDPAVASDPATIAADPNAEHITFDGPDAEPGPSDQVVAPPQRPPMPSMMTDVLKTGPRL